MKFLDKSNTEALWFNAKVGLITLLFAFPPYGIVNHFYYDRPAVNLAIPVDSWLSQSIVSISNRAPTKWVTKPRCPNG